MTLVVKMIGGHKSAFEAESECQFGPDGGTIGRSQDNDWVLNDEDRFISGKHAVIDCRSGSYYLADVSSNGVYVNYSPDPLGRGNPHRLFNGDHLRMGNFELRVILDDSADLELPPETRPSVLPDQIDPLFPVDDAASSLMLLDEEEITGSDAFSAMLGIEQPSSVGDIAADPQTDGRNAKSSGSVSRVRQSADHDALLDKFLIAAGIDPKSIDPSVDPVAVLTNAGEVLNELVGGMTELMVARSNMKNMFRLEQTGVMPQLNNPIKLSANTADSIQQLLLGQEGEYLGPLASVREACKDLRWHHDAVVSAMIKSFSTYVERLDPEQLEKEYQETHNGKPLFSAMAKRKYWDYFCDVYPVVTQVGNASLPQAYSEHFVEQYDKQLSDFARLESSLRETQTLRMPPSGQQNPRAGDAYSTSRDESNEVILEGDEEFEATTLDNRPRAAN